MAFETVVFDRVPTTAPLRGYVGIFVVTFLVFLAVALASMLVAKNWRTFLPGAEGANSMWDGVTRAVYTVISQLS